MARLPYLAASLVAAAALSLACGDDLIGPETPGATLPLALSAGERDQMRGALLFAGQQSTAALQSGADELAVAFAALARGVERNDRIGVERGIASARAALRQYRQSRGSDAADPDLEALILTLDQVAARTTASLSPEDNQP